jgi:arsenical pump membrane protein
MLLSRKHWQAVCKHREVTDTPAEVLVWTVAALTIAGVLFRPNGWPEAVWACLGAVILVLSGLLPVAQAAVAVAKGLDVYLFLTGMMLLSELARREGVFDWLASFAVGAAHGSRARLFTLVYLVGTGVTVLLSNDATAVVLTPAVYAAVKKARTKALPYLLVCAFIANAASFVLPISNPANLVVYGGNMPPLVPWLRTFFLPSLLSILATYFVLRWFSRHDLGASGSIEAKSDAIALSREGRFAAWGIAATGAILLGASALGRDLGLPTCVAAVCAVLATTHLRRGALLEIVKGVSWMVLPLVAGLFVVVEALNHAGALRGVGVALTWCASLPRVAGSLAASFGVATLSNIMNNLPSGLLAGGALRATPVPAHIRNAILIGVDLGPNLSVTGSLATILWLIALRREGQPVSPWQFLKAGFLVMPPALLLATIAVSLSSK